MPRGRKKTAKQARCVKTYKRGRTNIRSVEVLPFGSMRTFAPAIHGRADQDIPYTSLKSKQRRFKPQKQRPHQKMPARYDAVTSLPQTPHQQHILLSDNNEMFCLPCLYAQAGKQCRRQRPRARAPRCFRLFCLHCLHHEIPLSLPTQEQGHCKAPCPTIMV